jgi:hypothetical protein
MPLPKKQLELKLTVGGSINAFRNYGRAEDADELDRMANFMADMTNYTRDEILAIEMADFPEFARQFAELTVKLKAEAVPPPMPANSSSGEPALPVTTSPNGATS